MGRGQPTSRNGGATPASSLIIFLEQRVAELETQRDEAEQFASNMENWIARAEAAEAKVVELHETYARWKADWVDIDKTREAKVAELETTVEVLASNLADAIENIGCWAGYASEYFQDKYDLAGMIKAYQDVLAALKPKENRDE